jgi:hypothetical protein
VPGIGNSYDHGHFVVISEDRDIDAENAIIILLGIEGEVALD